MTRRYLRIHNSDAWVRGVAACLIDVERSFFLLILTLAVPARLQRIDCCSSPRGSRRVPSWQNYCHRSLVKVCV